MSQTPQTPQTQMTSQDAARTARTATYWIAKLIVTGFAAGCLYFSFGHIIDLAHRLGATGAQAYTAPAFIDGFMLLGRLGMAPAFDAATRLIGRRMMTCGALLSLAANIAAGQTPGDRIIGGAVVLGFLITEWYAGKLKPAPIVVDQAAILKAKRSAAAKKAAATRAATKAAAATKTRKPRTRKPAASPAQPKAPTLAAAPVSPAPGGRMVNGLWVASTVREALMN